MKNIYVPSLGETVFFELHYAECVGTTLELKNIDGTVHFKVSVDTVLNDTVKRMRVARWKHTEVWVPVSSIRAPYQPNIATA